MEAVLGAAIPNPEVREVRHVAPKKDMMYIAFVLPAATAYTDTTTAALSSSSSDKRSHAGDDQGSDAKRPKTE